MATDEEIIKVVQAHLNGQEIEAREWLSGEGWDDWKRTLDLGWNWSLFEYRIKDPEINVKFFKDDWERFLTLSKKLRQFMSYEDQKFSHRMTNQVVKTIEVKKRDLTR